MTEKELLSLKKSELLEIMLAQSREIPGLVTCGSDLHNVTSIKLGQAGLVFSHRVQTGRAFVEALREGACAFLVEGSILPRIREADLP